MQNPDPAVTLSSLNLHRRQLAHTEGTPRATGNTMAMPPAMPAIATPNPLETTSPNRKSEGVATRDLSHTSAVAAQSDDRIDRGGTMRRNQSGEQRYQRQK